VFITVALVAAAPTSSTSEKWFTVEWEAPEFTAMSGDFVVPNVSNGDDGGGTYLVWPGLQGDEGVIQAALDGQMDTWTVGASFYGSPAPLLGSRFQVFPGDKVHFSFTRITDSGLWMCTLTGLHDTERTFSLPTNTLNRAIFAVDLSSVAHDFTVTYSDVSITASTLAANWCGTIASTGYSTGGYVVKNATAEGTTCRIGQIILPRSV